MTIKFQFIQDENGEIHNLHAIRPFIGEGTYGDQLINQCLKDYEIDEDKRGFSFKMEYDETMQKALGYLSWNKDKRKWE
jgi:hypothetical protein